MSFLWPLGLLSLLLVPVAAAAYLLAQRKRARYAVRYTNLPVLASVVGRGSAWRRWVPVGFYLLGLVSLLIGLGRPQADVNVPKEQATVILVMDVSGSMNATDVEPTRIEAARRSATTFVDVLPKNFPIGIVSFDEAASVLSKPTINRSETHEIIDGLQADGGTAMGDAIQRALELRPGGPTAPPRDAKANPDTILLVLSDGATTTGSDPIGAADSARGLHIPVYTIALGTPDGTLNPYGGRRIPVPPDEETLHAIADRTGGRFFSAPSDSELRGIYEELGSRIGFVKERQEVTVLFGAAALLLLVAGATVSLLWNGRLP